MVRCVWRLLKKGYQYHVDLFPPFSTPFAVVLFWQPNQNMDRLIGRIIGYRVTLLLPWLIDGVSTC